MNIKAFEVVRDNVTAEDAARFYGLAIQRGKALCPFHNDNHPSMTFRKRRFRCWACGASGSAIDLTAQIFGLSLFDAVKRLNEDFRLGIDLDSKPDPKAVQERQELSTEHREFEQWRDGFIRDLCRVHRRAHLALQERRELTDAEAEAVRHMAEAEYYCELLDESPEDQAAVYRDRGLISEWISRALRN